MDGPEEDKGKADSEYQAYIRPVILSLWLFIALLIGMDLVSDNELRTANFLQTFYVGVFTLLLFLVPKYHILSVFFWLYVAGDIFLAIALPVYDKYKNRERKKPE